MFLSTIVVDGEIVGTWRRTARRLEKRPVTEIAAEPFDRLSTASRRAFERAARRYGEFVDLPVVFS